MSRSYNGWSGQPAWKVNGVVVLVQHCQDEKTSLGCKTHVESGKVLKYPNALEVMSKSRLLSQTRRPPKMTVPVKMLNQLISVVEASKVDQIVCRDVKRREVRLTKVWVV